VTPWWRCFIVAKHPAHRAAVRSDRSRTIEKFLRYEPDRRRVHLTMFDELERDIVCCASGVASSGSTALDVT
jgi:hypothetical protein